MSVEKIYSQSPPHLPAVEVIRPLDALMLAIHT